MEDIKITLPKLCGEYHLIIGNVEDQKDLGRGYSIGGTLML